MCIYKDSRPNRRGPHIYTRRGPLLGNQRSKWQLRASHFPKINASTAAPFAQAGEKHSARQKLCGVGGAGLGVGGNEGYCFYESRESSRRTESKGAGLRAEARIGGEGALTSDLQLTAGPARSVGLWAFVDNAGSQNGVPGRKSSPSQRRGASSGGPYPVAPHAPEYGSPLSLVPNFR